jgi:predicted anti-sigma-YlaC factor YlaD
MRCEDCREAISARLDSEDLPGEADAVDAHLRMCADCRVFAERAARVRRLTRVRLAEPEPDLVGAVLAAGPPRSVRSRAAGAVRVALGGLGVGQVALAISGIAAAAGPDHGGVVELAGGSAAHLVHESSAWNLAIGVAFLLAAMGSRRVSGMVPVLGAFIAALAALSAFDLAEGRVEVERLLGHGLALAGLVLLMVLGRLADDGGGGADRATPDSFEAPAVGGPDAAGERPTGRASGGGLAPSARRGAA